MVELKERFEAKTARDDSTGCWEWTASKRRDGYGQFSANGRTQSAHRVSFEIYHGEIPAGRAVLHRCDNPACVNPDHLFIGTQAENIQDKVSKGRQSCLRGEAHGRAKLTSDDVIAIRASSESSQILGKKFGVSDRLVLLIRSRRAWKHL